MKIPRRQIKNSGNPFSATGTAIIDDRDQLRLPGIESIAPIGLKRRDILRIVAERLRGYEIRQRIRVLVRERKRRQQNRPHPELTTVLNFNQIEDFFPKP